MEFKLYRKRVPTRARVLTERDYQTYQGLIQTPEGPQQFHPGDYLAQDDKGEWPIKQSTIQTKYQQIDATDANGFASYLRTEPCLAAQMPEPFTIEGLNGKAGDYLVLGGQGGWPVDREIFEHTYSQEN